MSEDGHLGLIEYRGGRRRKRSKKERDADFVVVLELLKRGMTWHEMANFISEHRPYDVTAGELSSSYNTRLQNARLEVAPEIQKQAILDDIEAIKIKALKAFNDSIGEAQITVETGFLNADGGFIKPTKTIRTIKQTGNNQYLATYLNAIDRQMKLMNFAKDDVNIIFNNLVVADGNDPDAMKPVRSESELDES